MVASEYSDVFISYRRTDVEFAKKLVAALKQAGKEVWVDWEDIPPGSVGFNEDIKRGLEGADAFICVLSPDYIDSQYTTMELQYAVELSKKLIPIVHTEVNDDRIPAEISHINWIYFVPHAGQTNDFESAIQKIIDALDTDLEHGRDHKRYLLRAVEWDYYKRSNSYLLKGDEIISAEQWITDAPGKDPIPTELHKDYISASRLNATRRQQRLLFGVSVALVLTIGLAIISLLLYNQANLNYIAARDNGNTATVAQGQALQNEATANAAVYTATVAQGQAQLNAETAIAAVYTATVAQGQALQNAATATVAQGQALNNAITATIAQGQAEFSEATAVANATIAYNERLRAQSIAMAAQAEIALAEGRQDRAVILALAALEQFGYSWQAERALGLAVQNELALTPLGTSSAWSSNLIFAPDGSQVVSVGRSRTVSVWDIANATNTTLPHSQIARGAVWSPDSTRLLTYTNNEATIWSDNYSTSNNNFTAPEGIIRAVYWQPNDIRVVTLADDERLIVWAWDGTWLTSYDTHQIVNLPSDYQPVVSFSPDGNWVASAGDDHVIHVWDANTGANQYMLTGHTLDVQRLLWSPDGQLLASIDNDTQRSERDSALLRTSSTARIWDMTSGNTNQTIYSHDDIVADMAWSPDSTRLATIGYDNKLYIWDIDYGGQILALPATTALRRIAWSPTNTPLIIGNHEGALYRVDLWSDVEALMALAQDCCMTRSLTDEESRIYDLTAPVSAPPPDSIASCADTLPSRMYPGVRGLVTEDDGSGQQLLNVRAAASLQGTQIRQLPPDQTFMVVAGPECADGYAWFKIIFGADAITGWVAEGLDPTYYIEPIP